MTEPLFYKLLRAYMRHVPLAFGKTRLLRAANAIAPITGERTARTRFGALMQLDLEQFIQRHIYFMGVYEPHILQTMELVRRAGPVAAVLDVGANVGQHSLFAAKALAAARVFAFEPALVPFVRLQKNVALNELGATIETLRMALSDRAGAVTMETPVAGNDGARFVQDADPAAADVIPATTLDEFVASRDLARIELMKVDVEGAEARVLRGAQRTLAAGRIRAVIVEICAANLARFGDSGEELVKLLAAHGYRGFALSSRGLGRLPEAHPSFFEALFVVPEVAAALRLS